MMNKVGTTEVYYQGKWDQAIFGKCMAVVGSRRMTSYGLQVLEKLIPQLVQQGWTIVSGYMYGVDKTAHRLTVECGGRSIAVLGWGIDAVGDGDETLKREIIKNRGLIISLWQDLIAARWTFPARNKIVAEIAHEVIVVEAAEKSGSRITAQMMHRLGKPVWAVPGPITSGVSVGTNTWIAQGWARPWLGPAAGGVSDKSPKEPKLLKILREEPLDADELARKLGKPVADVGAELTLMVLSGQVMEKDRKYYVS